MNLSMYKVKVFWKGNDKVYADYQDTFLMEFDNWNLIGEWLQKLETFKRNYSIKKVEITIVTSREAVLKLNIDG